MIKIQNKMIVYLNIKLNKMKNDKIKNNKIK